MRRSKWQIPYEFALLVLGLAFVSPIVLIVLNSFKSLKEITAAPLGLPSHLAVTNYSDLFSKVDLGVPMLKSFGMTAITILCLVTFAPMAAYAMNRLGMAGARFWRNFFLIGLIVPFQIVMIPLLKEFRFLGIHYTYLSLLLVYVSGGLPLAIFIYSGFLSTVPKELDEAAVIDGCGPIATFWRIVFPLLKPCTVTIVIFWGLWVWNDFLSAFIFMGGTRGDLAFLRLFTLLQDKYVKDWGTIFAGVVVLSAPVTVLYLTMQRHLVKGLTAGAMK
ncbi:MAG: carbohydrate ABC transporter permease [Fimbriimonas sp.]|nr:carbohydrate ABC transporter permease [Fimbriimonas sp.]